MVTEMLTAAVQKMKKLPVIRSLVERFSSYGRSWDLSALTMQQAMKAILSNANDEETFDYEGERTARELSSFIKPNSVVLDLGCGIGRIEKFLPHNCKKCIGIDVSRRMISLAKKRLDAFRNVSFYRNNGRDLSLFPDRMFDFVFSIFTLQHLDKEDACYYLIEINRVLKQSGKAYIQFSNLLNDSNTLEFIEESKRKKRSPLRMRWYTPREVVKILKTIGFNVISLKTNKDIVAVIEKT